MKRIISLLLIITLLCTCLPLAFAEDDAAPVVIFEGEKTGTYLNASNIRNAVTMNLASEGISSSVFAGEFNIEIVYESEAAPLLILSSWTGGAANATVNAASADGSTAVYTYADMRRAYGDDFAHLNAITVRPNGATVTVRRITVVPVTAEEHQAVRFAGPAGDWLASVHAGWNLGNTFESYGTWIPAHSEPAVYERAWGNPTTTFAIIQAVADAGFDTIRIPVTWYPHMNDDYIVDEAWMDRVQTVVDYAVDAGLKVIINVHHDNGTNGWMHADLTRMDEYGPKFTALWTQIAVRFRDYDGSVVFESFNEILDADNHWSDPDEDACTAVNMFNQMFVDTVRATGGNNATRVLIVNTYAATHDEKALAGFVLPTDTVADSLIVEVHIYSPYSYCETSGNGYTDNDWIKVNGKGVIHQIINRLYTHFTSKGIPVLIGEFAAGAKENETNRAEWAAYLMSEAALEGIPCIWWDNGGKVNGTALQYREMGLLDRYTVTWLYPEIVETITGVEVTNIHP